MSGTFKLRPTLITSGGTPYLNNFVLITPGYIGWFNETIPFETDSIIDIVSVPFDNPHRLLAALINGNGPGTFNDTIRFSFFGNSIYLDGSSTPISFAGLPSGWTPLTAILNLHPIAVINITGSATAVFFLQLDVLTEGPQDSSSLAYSSLPSAIALLNNGCGLRVSLNVSNAFDVSEIDFQEVVIEGTYTIAFSEHSLVLQDSTTPVRIGDKVKIVTDPAAIASGSATVGQGILNGVAQVQISFSDLVTGSSHLIVIDTGIIDDQIPSLTVDGVLYQGLNFVIIQQQDTFWFYLPWGFFEYHGPITIDLIGDGTIFSGSVNVGILQILFEQASGIYKLDKTKTNDTLYFRDGYITDAHILMLPSMLEDEIYEDDFFSLLPYPRKILAQGDLEEDYERSDYSLSTSLRAIITPTDVEIPSPFITTAFLP